MRVVSADVVKAIASKELAIHGVEEAFLAAYNGAGRICPVVIASGCDDGNSFSIKAGCLTSVRLSGLKIGSYWAGNQREGLPNHSTTTLLLDEETGFITALVSAAYLNCLRTAAADALATQWLAREDCRVLGVLGAGNQAIFDIEAVCQVRNIDKILINSRSRDSVDLAIDRLSICGIAAEYSDCEGVCRAADILITITKSRAPLFEASWIRPGTHISAMGADQPGKQELPVSLVRSSRLFADDPEQSRSIGEFEVATRSNPKLDIIAIGAVLAGKTAGRESDAQVTIFDSSGIALQDLCVAKLVLDSAIQKGLATEVEF